MVMKSTYQTILEDAVRALRDIAELDETRPAKNAPEKVAERALERISKVTGIDVASKGHTPRPDEIMFPDTAPQSQALRRPRVSAPFYTGPIGTPTQREH